MSLALLGVGGAGAPPPDPTRSQEILADSPIGFWRLRDASGTTAVDSSGNGRDGTYSASGVTLGGTYDGEPGASFDGSAGFVDIYSAGLAGAFSANAYTLLAWCRTASATASTRRILSVRSTDTASEATFLSRNASPSVYRGTRSDVNDLYAVNGAALIVDAWVMVAFTYNRTSDIATMYVDANTPVTATGEAAGAWLNPLDSSGCVIAGIATVGTTARWLGQIADVAVFSTALSAARIAAIAAATND